MPDDRAAVRKLVMDLLARKGDYRGFKDSDSLILSGRLESIDTLEIVMFLESRYGIDFSLTGLDQAELDSIDQILAFAAAQRA